MIERSTINVMDGFERPTPNSARATRAYPATRDNLMAAIEKAVDKLPRWRLERRNESEVHAVRESRLFRFKDDVTVNIIPKHNGTEARFASASRVGKGDLGQNPRNLRELLETINGELGR